MIVIDASVWISFLVQQDVNHDASHTWMVNRITTGQTMVAPMLLLAEVGGAVAHRTSRTEMGNKVIDQLLAIPNLRLVSLDHALGIMTSRVAADHQLRGADAVYVAVAAHLKIPLVSWDLEQLRRASALITTYAPAQNE